MSEKGLPLHPVIKWLEHQRFAIDRYDGTGTTPPHLEDVKIVSRLVTEVQLLRVQLVAIDRKLKETESCGSLLDRGWDTGAVGWVPKKSGRGFKLACRLCGTCLGPTMKSKEDDNDQST
jgi:hypothetical protein